MDKKRFHKFTQIGDEISQTSLLPHVELDGNSCAVVEGCKGIIEYDSGTVKINCDSVILEFSGHDLVINTMSGDRICVNGTIVSLQYSN